ncbi:MAG: hypothetical protein A3E01_00620 [Gammaproteobacteria bacterium RIFCSPHIGHO2_12_FULL_63_22]|nr:MAG: hypothetical protein A3E01_00620 [Gammaproteobacteria bacterium RIFCSPHIGHO2_12_FULL_63_22]
MPIPVVDIFAGPGGLGEGFSSLQRRDKTGGAQYRIVVSAEMEKNAAATLRLRSFFRMFPKGKAPSSYYDYLAGRRDEPYSARTASEWSAAGREALQLKLGDSHDDAVLDARLESELTRDEPWVLIGGPPCQAYSLAGRSRNAGVKGYQASEDERHYLYRHYLRLIARYRPAVFIMENVTGLLSSKVDGVRMFPKILDDLRSAAGPNSYRLVPLVASASLTGLEPEAKDFIVRAEDFGAPQARHRVILMGVSQELPLRALRPLVPSNCPATVRDVIGGLPKLRSGLTDFEISSWRDAARAVYEKAAAAAETVDEEVASYLARLGQSVPKKDPGSGGRWIEGRDKEKELPRGLAQWILDGKVRGYANHEVRPHMSADLERYAYAAVFAELHGRSPRGRQEFPKPLHPKHKSWKADKFVDRFKVQLWDAPSSTLLSHLSKDGHYFIHPDPTQLRSISVREAARLQTFPDNYFFEGARGAQFRQVGNAVPPFLASQIAAVVQSILD